MPGSGLVERNPTPAPAITTQVQSASWPPRVLVTVSGMATWGIISVVVYRVVAGVRTLVRGGFSGLLSADAFVVLDAEEPFGTQFTYVAAMGTAAGTIWEVTSDPLSVAITGVALTDAITGRSAQVVISAWPDKRTARPSTSFVVGGRNIVVAGDRPGFTSTIEVIVESDSARDNLDALLNAATGGVLQIRQPGGYGGVDCYVTVTGDSENRWSQDGSDQRRLWSLDVVEVDPWPSTLLARGFTYADVAAKYSTYADVAAQFGTYLALAQGDFS